MKEVKQWKKELKEKVLQKIDYGREMTDREVEDIIDEVMLQEEFVQVCPVSMRQRIRKELFDSMRRLDILQMFVDDPSITEIMINGKDCLFIEREGRLEEMNIKFESTEKLQQVIQQIVAGCNRMVNEASPIVDARLENGARVNIVMNPVALDGPAVTIRRFPEKPITMEDLIHRHSLSKESAAFLKMLVQARYNIFISGGTGSGKTTMLNVLSGYVTGGERVITIEDNAELQLQGIRNLVRLEVRNSNVEGCREISIRDLIKTSLRMRPDRILVGEVRGAEAVDMIQAMNTGHEGSMSTGHANSARDMLARLENMILMGMEIPLQAIRQQIASGIDIIIHLGRLRDRSRRVLEIVELVGCEADKYVLNPIYIFEETGETDMDSTSGVAGELQKKGELVHGKKLQMAGIRCAPAKSVKQQDETAS